MYAEERHQRIVTEARRAGRVEVATLAELLSVAPETVRRDLTALERRGTLRRVHGGAIPIERLELEPSVAIRTSRRAAEKRRIAARALQELPHEGTVMIDSGTSTQALVEMLPLDLDLTVLTNSLAAASVLVNHPGISLYVLGGRVRGRTGAAVGDWARAALAEVYVDVAFMGTNGFSPEHGFTTPDQAEASAKRAMVSAARRTVVLADASKADDDHLHRFASTDEVAMLITDASLDDERHAAFAGTSLTVVTA